MRLFSYVVSAIVLSAQMLAAHPGKGQGRVDPSAEMNKKIILGSSDEDLGDVLKKIEKLSGIRIAYPWEEVSHYTHISFARDTRSVGQTLREALSSTIFDYGYESNTIILFRKKTADAGAGYAATPQQEPQIDTAPSMHIFGKVIDEKSKEPVSEASVVIKNTKTGILTDKYGEFLVNRQGTGSITLVVSHIGYTTKEVTVRHAGDVSITLTESDQTLTGVEVSTGMFRRKKESFTGATASFTGDQIRSIGNQNIIQSLKALDPSFQVIDNNSQGSNPTTLPSIELRGTTSLNPNNNLTTNNTLTVSSQYNSDPNLPLFILDGFESTLQMVVNLDINRVASVTILKDAASTAIYGAKAANGVVVVETIRPKSGELRVSYTGGLNLSIPDLSSYNMMNAGEKLEFERLAGRYDAPIYYSYNPVNTSQYGLDGLYNNRLAEVNRGVNTYWLSEPVRLAAGSNHSLTLSGGNNELVFGTTLSYTTNPGVMKGSDNPQLNGNIALSYRKGKLAVNNNLYITSSNNHQSPYGSFTNFVNANPYYRKRNADGFIPEYLDPDLDSTIINPLYNARLNSTSSDKQLGIQEQLGANWDLFSFLRLEGQFQFQSQSDEAVQFIAPENSLFDNVDTYQKGSYANSRITTNNYTGSLSLNFHKLFAQKHSLSVYLRSQVQQNSGRVLGFSAVGFPFGSNGDPAYAYSFTPYSSPSSTITTTRETNLVGSLSYTFDNRYTLEANYTLDGSSAFGSNKKYKDYWSVGASWNLDKERLFHGLSGWLDYLKLRGNIGANSNENLGAFTSVSVYDFLAGTNVYGQSLVMNSLGNPNLESQTTLQTSLGIDFGLLHNRVSGYVNYFHKNTDPLVVPVGGDLPSSVGLSYLPGGYPINVGTLTSKGWEASLQVSPIYKVRQQIVWTVGISAASTKQTYSHFGNTLDALNKTQQDINGLMRYRDGYSPDDIWAVRSLGIDPATGNELFLKRDGTQSFTYDAADIVKVGNIRPIVTGILSSTLTYKGLNAGIYINYNLGGYVYNTALYNKVENIGWAQLNYNQDKRALYDRWKAPGDRAPFKAITDFSYTPPSSRFVQKDNHFDGASVSLGWTFRTEAWLKKLGLQTLGVNGYLNEIFRLESVKTERGIDYPFARKLSFTIHASF